jgi:hypothetical protein
MKRGLPARPKKPVRGDSKLLIQMPSVFATIGRCALFCLTGLTILKTMPIPETSTNRNDIAQQSAPKRPMSAFFYFTREESDRLWDIVTTGSASHDILEEAKHFRKYVGEWSKELARRLSNLQESERSKYEDMARDDQARYGRELDACANRNL